jgi:hypothetical protein
MASARKTESIGISIRGRGRPRPGAANFGLLLRKTDVEASFAHVKQAIGGLCAPARYRIPIA